MGMGMPTEVGMGSSACRAQSTTGHQHTHGPGVSYFGRNSRFAIRGTHGGPPVQIAYPQPCANCLGGSLRGKGRGKLRVPLRRG